MRLWHYKLIEHLPDKQLLGQNRECYALLGKGWNKPHKAVNYVFKQPKYLLQYYQNLIAIEMTNRGFNPKSGIVYYMIGVNYPEHDDMYLSFCLHNLKYAESYSTKKPKGIDLFDKFPEIKDCGFYDKEEEYKYLNKGA